MREPREWCQGQTLLAKMKYLLVEITYLMALCRCGHGQKQWHWQGRPLYFVVGASECGKEEEGALVRENEKNPLHLHL